MDRTLLAPNLDLPEETDAFAPAAKTVDPYRSARVTGFGQFNGADGYLYRPTTLAQLRELMALARETGPPIVLRGSGRSYGDAAIGRNCLILDMTRMRRILSWDPAGGLIECEPGVTLEMVWRHTLEDGYWPPIVSGTMYPTLGGALAMNIHGKNNYVAGTLGEHVQELDVLFPTGELRTLRPEDELFRAVISGFGALGVMTRIVLKLKKIESGNLKVYAASASNWDEQFAIFERFEHDSDYMVSWIDCFGRGREAGRGLFHAAWYVHDDAAAAKTLNPDYQDLPDTVLGFFPKSTMWRVLKLFCNRPGMNFINWAKYKSGTVVGNHKMHEQSLVAFSFLLDYVPNWRKAYEPGGFIQYQSFVPKEHARRVFARQVEMQQEAKMESYLGVMKRHRPDKFLFSHAVDGYSMALDFKVTSKTWPKLQDLAHRMNDLVLDAGGRFYLAKDSTLRPGDVERYMGEEALATYRRLRAEVDPEGLLTSELARRLRLA